MEDKDIGAEMERLHAAGMASIWTEFTPEQSKAILAGYLPAVLLALRSIDSDELGNGY